MRNNETDSVERKRDHYGIGNGYNWRDKNNHRTMRKGRDEEASSESGVYRRGTGTRGGGESQWIDFVAQRCKDCFEPRLGHKDFRGIN